jgi:hypothetical protein
MPSEYQKRLEDCKNSEDGITNAVNCLLEEQNDKIKDNLDKVLILSTYIDPSDIFIYDTTNKTIILTPDIQQIYNNMFEEKYNDDIDIPQFIELIRKIRMERKGDCLFCGITRQ